jgi:hypothetical protein
MKVKCDSCGDKVEDDIKAWDKHNKENYVRHVFNNHSPEDAKKIIQQYINRH